MCVDCASNQVSRCRNLSLESKVQENLKGDASPTNFITVHTIAWRIESILEIAFFSLARESWFFLQIRAVNFKSPAHIYKYVIVIVGLQLFIFSLSFSLGLYSFFANSEIFEIDSCFNRRIKSMYTNIASEKLNARRL